MLFKSVSITQLHALTYAKIVSSDEKTKKNAYQVQKNVLDFVPFQKLSFVKKLKADG